MNHKCEIKQKKSAYEVKFSLTADELMALQAMLRMHDTAVRSDVCAYFANAMQREGINLSC